MADSNKPGNNAIPDFKQLNDRIIVEHTDDPILVIKTNLDPKDATEENPYYHNKKMSDEERKSFLDFFKE